jgi:transcription antitermination factor NusG
LELTQRELCPEASCSGYPALAQDSRHWFAITVKPRHEFAVEQGSTAKALDALAPTLWTVRRWSDRIEKLQRPLFPEYAFGYFDSAARTSVLKTPGAKSIDSFADTPNPIPDEQISSIRQMPDSSFPVQTHPWLREGQRVRIDGGPLAGLEGILNQCRNTTHVVVSIDLLQRPFSVQVDSRILIPL